MVPKLLRVLLQAMLDAALVPQEQSVVQAAVLSVDRVVLDLPATRWVLVELLEGCPFLSFQAFQLIVGPRRMTRWQV